MSAISSQGIIHDFFVPLPEGQSTREKDPLDHAAEYADTAAGAWDAFRFIEHALSYVKMLPSIPENCLDVVQRVKDVANTAGIGLSIPKAVADFNNFRRGLCDLFAVQDLPYSDPLRARKIAQAVKKTFVDSVDLTNTLSQAALFVENAKLFVFQVSHLTLIDGVYNLTSVISDSSELITECFKLHNYRSPELQPRNQVEAAKLEERKTLSWMVVAKDVASIGGGAIALVGIVFGVVTESFAVVSIAALALSSVWLTMKLAAYFYNKIIVEAPAVSNRLAVANI